MTGQAKEVVTKEQLVELKAELGVKEEEDDAKKYVLF